MNVPLKRIVLSGALAALLLGTAVAIIIAARGGPAAHLGSGEGEDPGIDARGPIAAAGPPRSSPPAGEKAIPEGATSSRLEYPPACVARAADERQTGPAAPRAREEKIDPREIPASAITDALLKRALRLSSAPLGAALEKALEGEDRGPLLGLLIANLTEHGTNFTAEELPLLVEALKGEKGHEVQSLLLAHIDRIESTEEDWSGDVKAAGYISYLRESQSPSHAEEVVGRLAKIRSPEAVEGLIGILNDGSAPRARRRVVEALGQIGDPTAVRSLSRALEGSEDPGERAAVLKSLASIGDRAALEAILGHAAWEENRAALGALQALDARKDPQSVPLLAQALLDPTYPDFQLAVLRKLSRDGDPRIERTLQRAIDGAGQPRVLAAALDTLGGIGTRESLPYLAEKIEGTADPAARRNFQRAWKRISDRLSAERGRG